MSLLYDANNPYDELQSDSDDELQAVTVSFNSLSAKRTVSTFSYVRVISRLTLPCSDLLSTEEQHNKRNEQSQIDRPKN